MRSIGPPAGRSTANRFRFRVDRDNPLVVRTAFGLTAERKRQVTGLLRSMGMPSSRPVRFDRDPGLVVGMELRGDGSSVGWSVGDYLESFGDLVRASTMGPDPFAWSTRPVTASPTG